MSTTAETLQPTPASVPEARPATAARAAEAVLPTWLRAQAINVTRHAAALRPFTREEFGSGNAAPSEGHLQAANALVTALRKQLLARAETVQNSVEAAQRQRTSSALQGVVTTKEQAHDLVRAVEKVWDFYFELFGQRQSRFGAWLLSCDRIALDCYQAAFMGLGKAKSIPAPPPFSYMRTGFSPATFRRAIPLARLGRQLNPFPLIELPYHRLVNPWTLGAVLHEVSHNLHNDLGLDKVIPQRIMRDLIDARVSHGVARVWARWNRETFADLSGLLLGGPAIVASLMDVVGRSPAAVTAFSPRAPHPTPYLRTLISVELLRRMGFRAEAESYRRAWLLTYRDPRPIPRPMLDSFPHAARIVVETICFRPYPQLGGRSLAQVMNFPRKNQTMIEEAARRLASGTDPGIVPERFLIAAARLALDNRLARPGAIAENFYKELARR